MSRGRGPGFDLPGVEVIQCLAAVEQLCCGRGRGRRQVAATTDRATIEGWPIGDIYYKFSQFRRAHCCSLWLIPRCCSPAGQFHPIHIHWRSQCTELTNQPRHSRSNTVPSASHAASVGLHWLLLKLNGHFYQKLGSTEHEARIKPEGGKRFVRFLFFPKAFTWLHTDTPIRPGVLALVYQRGLVPVSDYRVAWKAFFLSMRRDRRTSFRFTLSHTPFHRSLWFHPLGTSSSGSCVSIESSCTSAWMVPLFRERLLPLNPSVASTQRVCEIII